MSFRVEPAETPDPWPPPATQDGAAGAPAPSDIAAAILELVMQSRGAQQDSARANAERAHELLERARREMQEAMERARHADENGDFWSDVSGVFGSDIASIAGVVAAVALAIATGGAGTAAVLAVVAAGLTAGAKVGQELGADARLTAALGVAGGVLGLFAGNAAEAGNAWTTVAQVGSAVQGGAGAAGGGASIAEGQYRGQAALLRADAKAAEGRQNDAWMRYDLAIQALEQASRDVLRARENTSTVQRTEHGGTAAVIARIGAA